MRNTKKFLSVLLAVLMIFSVAPLGGLEGVTASAASFEGTCGADGDNLKWSFDTETGELKITGNGEMYDYDYGAPWNNYKKSIKTVTIEDGVTSICEDAFSDCSKLSSVKIGSGVISIGDCAFVRCESLESVELGSSVTSIGKQAFDRCFSLKSIKIPDSVTSIGDHAFNQCSKLSSVEIGSGVTSIGGNAFSCCGFESITIPDSVTSIGDAAFHACDSLQSITIPDSVTSIGNYVFSECSKLSSVEIGSGVTSIGEYAFFGLPSLEGITVDDNNDYYSSDSYGVLYNKDKTTLVQYPIGNTRTSFDVPDSVTSIGAYAFTMSTSLERVTIPDSVTSIGFCAFGYCTSLKSAIILNPECEFVDVNEEYQMEMAAFPEGTIIHGYANSTAQQYAEKHGFQFTSHTPDSEGIVIKEATCKEAGLKAHKCTFCGVIVSTEEIPTNGEHTPREAVKEKEIAATCSSAGSYDMVVYCDVCGEVISRVTYTTDKLPHTESGWIIDKEADCEHAGSKHTQCTVCGETIHKEEIPAKGHTDNNDDGVCDECGNTIPVDTTGCDCVCHRVEKIPKIIYKILRAFWRLFKINKKCKCGTYHWIL